MQKIAETRESDSPFIQSVTHVKYTGDCVDIEPPDGHWAIVILNHHGQTKILHTGTVTKAIGLRFEKDDEYTGISFKPSTFLTRFPAQQLVDTGLVLPRVDKQKFWLGNGAWEIPTFDNAEALVNRLAASGLLATDEAVHSVLNDLPNALSLRSIQRHFLQATGITLSNFRQIQRAREAVGLLQTGSTPLEAALSAGYYDQAHMTNSLRKILGRTPTEIIRSAVR